MKCNLFGTVVGKRVIKSRDGKEYPSMNIKPLLREMSLNGL